MKSFFNSLNPNRYLVFWWICLWSQIAAFILAYLAGFINLIYVGDATKITSIIFVLHIFTSAKLGYDTARGYKRNLNHLWFMTDVALTLGMLGTVLGFLIMMYGAFADGIPTTPAQIETALLAMVLGMGSALWTTAVGLISSLLLKIQVLNLETLLEITQEEKEIEKG